jgi:MrcB-like, N-terminal domain
VQNELQRILDLQPSWDRANTPAMYERGRLVRNDVARWLIDNRSAIASAIAIPAGDFLAEGGDGTGGKARVPWTRFASRQQSPKPTVGFMAAFLWGFPPERAVYLSLLQGVYEADALRENELLLKPLEQLRTVRAWARSVIEPWLDGRDDLVPLRLGDPGAGRGYERGVIASIRYATGEIPEDEQLLADALSVAQALGELYRAEARTS